MPGNDLKRLGNDLKARVAATRTADAIRTINHARPGTLGELGRSGAGNGSKKRLSQTEKKKKSDMAVMSIGTINGEMIMALMTALPQNLPRVRP
jgi:hypothetical protein